MTLSRFGYFPIFWRSLNFLSRCSMSPAYNILESIKAVFTDLTRKHYFQLLSYFLVACLQLPLAL